MKEHHLERLGVESKEQQEILQDVLLLRVQEELENLNDIYAGEARLGIYTSGKTSKEKKIFYTFQSSHIF